MYGSVTPGTAAVPVLLVAGKSASGKRHPVTKEEASRTLRLEVKYNLELGLVDNHVQLDDVVCGKRRKRLGLELGVPLAVLVALCRKRFGVEVGDEVGRGESLDRFWVVVLMGLKRGESCLNRLWLPSDLGTVENERNQRNIVGVMVRV